MPILYYKSRDEIPAELGEVATEVTEDGDFKGQFAVNVVARKKLDEFRSNNTELAQKLETTNATLNRVAAAAGIAKLDEFDPETYAKELSALKDTARKVADGKLQASDDVEKEVSKRTEAMRNKFDQSLQEKQVEVNTMRTERDRAIADYKRTFIDRAVAGVIADPDLGLAPTALTDVMQKAYTIFHVEEDGTLTPKKNGQTMWGEDGTTKMSMKEWIDLVLRKEAPHYFKRSTGGGAAGGAEKQYGGLSEADFNKLPPERRLQIANESAFSRGRR